MEAREEALEPPISDSNISSAGAKRAVEKRRVSLEWFLCDRPSEEQERRIVVDSLEFSSFAPSLAFFLTSAPTGERREGEREESEEF